MPWTTMFESTSGSDEHPSMSTTASRGSRKPAKKLINKSLNPHRLIFDISLSLWTLSKAPEMSLRSTASFFYSLDGLDPSQDLKRHQFNTTHLWSERPLRKPQSTCANQEGDQRYSATFDSTVVKWSPGNCGYRVLVSFCALMRSNSFSIVFGHLEFRRQMRAIKMIGDANRFTQRRRNIARNPFGLVVLIFAKPS